MGERLVAIKGKDSDVDCMSEATRQLMFKVADDDFRVLPILRFIYQYVRCDDILRWCINNQITGHRFTNTLRYDFGASPDKFVRYILGKIQGQPKGPILYGIDWKP